MPSDHNRDAVAGKPKSSAPGGENKRKAIPHTPLASKTHPRRIRRGG